MNILYIFICYLLGSIPSALIIGKTFKGIDIRDHGSGNLGATNAIRVLGKKLGGIVAFMDVFKGSLAMVLAQFVFNTDVHPLVFGLFAVIGHVFPIFANFKGGKAVATSGGIILLFAPPVGIYVFLTGLISFFISLKLTRYVSVSSSVAAIMISVATLLLNFFYLDNFDYYFSGVIFFLTLFVLYRHIPNYKRLINRTETKVGQKKQ